MGKCIDLSGTGRALSDYHDVIHDAESLDKVPDSRADTSPAMSADTVPTGPVRTYAAPASYNVMQTSLEQSSALVDDIVLKKYLNRLTDFDVIPIDPILLPRARTKLKESKPEVSPGFGHFQKMNPRIRTNNL